MHDPRDPSDELVTPEPGGIDRLFGLQIEAASQAGGYMLRDVAVSSNTLAQGPLPRCLRQRLERLEERYPRLGPHVPAPTLGGLQFWADVWALGEYRIQEQVRTRHCRLVSPLNVRLAYGDYPHCRVAMEALRIQKALAPASNHAVVLLHGLNRTSGSMVRLEAAFRKAGYEVLNLNYPSTQGSVEDHARQVRAVLSRLRGVSAVSFVTHSMGGLIARKLLSLPAAQEHDWRERIAVQRLLMLCPPSQGARKADKWYKRPIARLVEGPALDDLRPESARRIPSPPCPFAIIAGSRDRTVLPDEALLPEADAVRFMDIGHTFTPTTAEVVRAAVHYIETGSL